MSRYFNMNNTTAYDSIIMPLSMQYGVNDALIRAVISQESSWNSNAYHLDKNKDGTPKVNKNGVVLESAGLMQVLVSTAREVTNNPNLTLVQLYDPYINLPIGVKYLAKKLSRYGGDIKKALSAYNMGTAKYKFNGDFSNQDYVDKVWGFYQQYLGYAIVQNIATELASIQTAQGDNINTSMPIVDSLGSVVADSIDNSTSDIPDDTDTGQTGTVDDPNAIELPFNPLLAGVVIGGVLFVGGGFAAIKKLWR